MKINKLLESKSIKESNDKEVIFQRGNKKIIKDGYGYGIEDDNNVTTNRFYVNDKGEPKFDDGTPNKFWLDKVNSLIKSGKLTSRKTTNEAFEKDGGPFWYFTKHGLGPGMLPKGVNVVETKEDDNFGTYVALDKVLTTQELKEYELVEKRPEMREDMSHFEFTSGANPYIAKTKDEANRVIGCRGDNCRFVGNINGIDYYKVDDGEEKDLFRVEEAFKPTESGIQSVKVYNRYNYTIQELRVDNDNKTFERGNFTAGKADKKVKNRQEYEDIVDNLKKLGYEEIPSDYHSLRNKTRKGIPTNEEVLHETESGKDELWNQLNNNEYAYKTLEKVVKNGIEKGYTKQAITNLVRREIYSMKDDFGRLPTTKEERLELARDFVEDELQGYSFTEDETTLSYKRRGTWSKNESLDSNIEGKVEKFLNKYGFDDERYPHIISSYKTTEEMVVKVSFNDGISAKDYNVIKKHLDDLGADIYLASRHKDSTDGNELWATVEFEFDMGTLTEARRKTSDPKQIEKAEKSMLNSLMNGAYDSGYMIQEAKMLFGITYDEAMKAFRNAHNEFMRTTHTSTNNGEGERVFGLVNPAELTDCPACGDISFDSKRGSCTKCLYREELSESKSIKEDNDTYYVTVYEETSTSGPEEGGYTSYGWEATHSKKFNSLEKARKYLNDFADGAEVIYNSGDTMEINDEWGDTYKIRIENEEDRGSSNSPAKSWAQAEMGVEFDRPFFDDEGKRLPEDPKVTAKRKADKEAIRKEFIDKLNTCQTKDDVMKLIVDRKYDSVEGHMELAMDKYKTLQESKEIKTFGAKAKKLNESPLNGSAKDYRFYVSCNDGPSKVVRTVADNEDRAIAYAKSYYAQEHSIYADDRHNKWSIENMDTGKIVESKSIKEALGNKFINAFKGDLEKVAEDVIINRLGYEGDFVKEYVFIDIYKGRFSEGDPAIICEIRTEMDYDECLTLGEALNSVLNKYFDDEPYFDMENSHTLITYLDPDSLINKKELQESKSIIDEDIEVNNIAHYIIDNYEFDDMQDKHDCINSIRDSFKYEKTISKEEIEQFVGGHNGRDKVNESATHCVYFTQDGKDQVEFKGTEDECNKYISDIQSEQEDEFGDEAPERFIKKLTEASKGFEKEFYNGYVILKNRAGDGYDIYSYDGTPEKVTKAYLEDEGYASLRDAKAEIDKWIDIANAIPDTTAELVGVEKRPHKRTDVGLNEDTTVSSEYEFDDDTDDLTYYYDDEVFKDNLENNPYTEVESKQVPDSDGFMTDYTMYRNINTGEYVFVFGDKDIYRPEDGYFDWECETEEEAYEWFNSYEGFSDEDELDFND